MLCNLLKGVNLNSYKIDSDWLPKYKFHVLNQIRNAVRKAVDLKGFKIIIFSLLTIF